MGIDFKYWVYFFSMVENVINVELVVFDVI